VIVSSDGNVVRTHQSPKLFTLTPRLYSKGYVACCGLPEPRVDHAIAMCHFAVDCLDRMRVLVKKLEVHLGPDTCK
jgi:hypothetical protein